MLTDPQSYHDSRRASMAADELTLTQKYRILDAMYLEARALGHFGDHDILLGLEDDIRLAAALNANVSLPPP